MTAKQDLGTTPLTAWELAEQSRAKLRLGSDEPGVLKNQTSIKGLLPGELAPKTMLEETEIEVWLDEYDPGIDGQHADDYYFIYLRGAHLPTREVKEGELGPIDSRTWPRPFDLSTVLLIDDKNTAATASSTEYEVAVVVEHGFTTNRSVARWAKIRVDRYPPYKSKQTDVASQPTVGSYRSPAPGKELDSAWLDINTELQVTIPTNYAFNSTSDDVEVFFSKDYSRTNPTDLALERKMTQTGDLSVPVAEDKLVNEPFYLYYRLTDVVGNTSEVSFARSIGVNILPAAVMGTPRVPSAPDGDTLDLGDLQGKVYVEVDQPANYHRDDDIEVFLTNAAGAGPYSLGSKKQGANRVLKYEMFYHDPLVTLFGNATGTVDVMAYYMHKRGAGAARKSFVRTFKLNLYYAGPPSEELPDLTNKKMVKVTVQGKDGGPNKLTAKDLKGDVTISTPMVAPGTDWDVLASEYVEMWYGKDRVFQKPLDNKDPLTAIIPPELLKPGREYAYWTIEFKNQPNKMSSELQMVEVEEELLVFPPPTIPLNRNGEVSCAQLEAPLGQPEWLERMLPVTVEVDLLKTPPGTIITVYSIGTEGADGLKEIPGTLFVEEHEVQALETEFKVDIKPYAVHIKPIQPPPSSPSPHGYIKVWYEVGEDNIPSDVIIKGVRLLGGGFYCDGEETLGNNG